MSGDRGGAESAGSWLRQLRESEGLTQEELAGLAGLAMRTISNLESDRVRRPHPRSLRMVADALGLSESASSDLRARFRRRAGAGTRGEPEQCSPEATPVAIPAQLPPAVALFAGQEAELARLDQWLEETRTDAVGSAVFTISGMAGVGKTALALYWAHRVASEFPDGQLHVSLGGYGEAGQPADADEGLSGFLRYSTR